MTLYEIKKEIAKACCEMNYYIDFDIDMFKAARDDYRHWKAYLQKHFGMDVSELN